MNGFSIDRVVVSCHYLIDGTWFRKTDKGKRTSSSFVLMQSDCRDLSKLLKVSKQVFSSDIHWQPSDENLVFLNNYIPSNTNLVSSQVQISNILPFQNLIYRLGIAETHKTTSPISIHVNALDGAILREELHGCIWCQILGNPSNKELPG